MSNKKKLLIIIVIIFFTVGAFSYLAFNFFSKYHQDKNQKTSELYEAKIESIIQNHLKNYDRSNSEKTVEELNQLLEKNKNMNPENEAFAKIILGDNYSPKDPVKGLGILKEVALNEKYPSKYRSLAINTIIDYYDYLPSNQLFTGYIFKGEPFEGFIQEGDINLAIARLADYSNELTPNAVAVYRAGQFYSIVLNNKNISEERKKELLSLVGDRLAKGGQLINSSEENAKWFLTASQRGLALRLQAKTLENLKFFGGQDISDDIIRNIYKNSILLLEKEPVDRHMKFFSYYSRFYYASFLSKIDSEKNKDEIKNVLSPLQDPSVRNYQIFGFLRKLKNETDPIIRKPIDTLSAVDPDFKKLIEEL